MASGAELAIILTGKDQSAGAVMDKVSGAAGGFGKALAGVGLLAGGALVAGLAASVTAAAGFEAKMSSIGAVSGATASEMSGLSDLALKLGADTAFSASEAAQGIEELVKGGLSIADVMGGGAKAALDLAAAGEISVADAAEIASNAVGQFGLKGADLGHVADMIAGAANASSLSVSDFKFSLGAAGAVAATVGFSFDDLAVAIAEMGKAGIKGSDAGTSLKTFMTSLIPDTKETKKLFAELGLTLKDGSNAFFDASGKVKSMADVQGILQNALKGMTEEQKLATLGTLFGSDAIRAAAVLAKSGSEGFDEMAASMGKVTAADVAAGRLNNLSGSLQALQGSLETAAITVGLKFTPLLKTGVDAAIAVVNGMIPMLAGFAQNFMDAFGTIQQVFGEGWSPDDSINPMVNAIGILATVIRDDVLPAAQAFAGFLGDNFGAILSAAAAILLAVVVPAFIAWADAAALAAVTTIAALAPVLLPLAAIGAAAALLYLAWSTNFLGIQDVTAAFWAFLQPVVAGILTEIGRFTTEMLPLATAAWTNLSSIVTSIAAALWAVIQAGVAALVAFWSDNHATIEAVATTVWSAIQGLVTASWTILQGIITVGLQVLAGDWSGAWTTMQNTLGSVWSQIQGAVGPAWDAIAGAVMGAIDGLISSAGAAGSGMVGAFVGGIMSRLGDARAAVERMAADIRALLPGSDAEEGPLSDVTASGAALCTTWAAGVDSTVGIAVESAAQLAGHVLESLDPILPSAALAIGQAVALRVGTGITQQTGVAVGAGREFGGRLIQALAPPLQDGAFDIGKSIPSMMAGGIRATTPLLVGALNRMMDRAMDAFDRGDFQGVRDAFNLKLPPLKFAQGGMVPGLMGAPMMVLAHGGETISPPGVSRGGGGGGDIYITVQGSVLSERDLVECVREGLIRTGRRNGDGSFNF